MRTIPALLCLCVLAPAAAQKPTSEQAALQDQAGARLEYGARARKLAKHDVVAHFGLARWCKQQRLPMCARWELHEVLRAAPNHVGARKMLGQAFHDDKWMPLADAMKAKGLVNVDGRWMQKYDAARYRRRHEQRLELQHELNALFAKLADRSWRNRARARRDLEALAKAEKMPELGRLVRRKAAEYDAFWRRSRRPFTAYTGILSVNAIQSTLERMDTFTTSLGPGGSVRLQLPQTRTISVGTTVAVPMGFGR